MPGCIDRAIASPCGGGSTICPAMMASMAFTIGSSLSGGSFFELGLDEIALPSGRGNSNTSRSTGTRRAVRIGDQPALAVSGRPREIFGCRADTSPAPSHRRQIAGSGNPRAARYPASSRRRRACHSAASLFARHQLLGEFLQRRRLGLRSVTIMVGRSGAAIRSTDRRPLDIRRHRQHSIDEADASLGFVGCSGHAKPERPRMASAPMRVRARMPQSIFRASSGSMIGMPSRIG